MFFCSAIGFLDNQPLRDYVDYYNSLIYFRDGRLPMIVTTTHIQEERITLPSGAVLNKEYIRSNALFVITGDLDGPEVEHTNRIPRSMIGVRPDGTLIFLMADSPTGARFGVTVLEGRKILESMGAVLTFNMDGCGSSQLFYNGTIFRQGEREVGTVFKIW